MGKQLAPARGFGSRIGRRQFLYGSALAAGGLAAAACAPTSKAPVRRLKLAATTTGVAGLLMRVVKDFGFLDQAGIPADVLFFDAGGTETAFAAGAVDVGPTDALSLAAYRNKGLPVVCGQPIVNCFFHVIVLKDSKYTSLASLEGTKHGQYGWSSSAATFMKVLAKADLGKDYEKMFDHVIAGSSVLPSMLDRKEIESTIVFPTPSVVLLESGKYRSVYSFGDAWKKVTGFPLTLSWLGLREEAIEAFGPDTIKALAQAFQKATQFMVTDTDKVLDKYETITGAKTPELKAAVKKAIIDGPIFQTSVSPQYIAAQEKVLSMAVDLKVLEKVPAGIFRQF